MARKRLAQNRALPPNLYVNSAGYYYYRDAGKKTQKVKGDKK